MSTRSQSKASDDGLRVVCSNKRAHRDYEIEETFEAGLVLVGTEVKSLREGRAQLKDAYAVVENNEVFLVGCHISAYPMATVFNHEPERRRKLLLGRFEIKRIAVRVRERGQTLVPLRIYFKRHLAKVEIALVRGKAQADRRQDIRRRDMDRDMEREVRQRHR
ncbi:MAG: SsrA-binding protein SmpB [Pseudomonadota bacterium]